MHQQKQHRRNSSLTSSAPLSAISSATLSVTSDILSCVFLGRLLSSDALLVALTSRPSIFYANLTAPYNEILGAPSSAA